MEKFYSNKRVFITGHTGFKGAWLTAVLKHFGAEVCGYSLEPVDDVNLFSILKIKDNSKTIIADIRDLETLKKSLTSFNPDIVFHLAAQPIVRESYREPVYTYETNVMGTVNLLEAIRHCKSVKSVVNVTTDKVYENKEINRGYIETDNLCGYDPYSNSKSCSELVTYSYVNSFFMLYDSPAVSTARAGNVIGAGDFSKDRIIPDCVRAGLEKRSIEIRNPNSVRPYQYVLDCLYGYLLLAKLQYNDASFAGSYNFGPKEEECITTEELVKKFCVSWGEDVSYNIKTETSVHESSLLMLDSTRAREKLNWIPKYDINNSIKKSVELYKCISYADYVESIENHIDNFFDME